MKNFSTTVARMLSVGVLMALVYPVAAQQTYPNRQIRIIVPFPPGGSNNVLARLMGQKLSESWSQPVLVDNRPGGNTIIGAEALAKSPPDGYTLMLTSSTHIMTALLLQTPYDAIKDFVPVATVSSTEQMLAVHPSVPAHTLQEFIALAKSRPGQLNYASSSSGSATHLAAAMFEILAGVKMQHVPYKGSGPALIDLIGGQVQLYFSTAINFIPHVRSGKLRALAISGERRFANLPNVPTFTEAGLPGLDLKAWYGILAPVGIPKEATDKLSAEIARILTLPDISEKLISQGMAPLISTPEQFAALMKSESATLARVIKAGNIKIE